MTSKSHKPVKQCQDCKLNMGERCAAFENPAAQWFHQDCDGLDSEELLAKHRLKNDGQGAHARKADRQEDAKKDHQIEHSEGHSKFKKLKFP